jgi:hypothetical protein
MNSTPNFYNLGWQDGSQDDDPVLLVPVSRDSPKITEENRKEYLAGWDLGQAMLTRAIRLGWQIGDPALVPPHKADADD